MKANNCPKCGEKGKAVKPITLQSLLKDSEKTRIVATDYWFCTTNSCPVVYFDAAGSSIFEKDALVVRVGIKETVAPRQVCFCFDHTIEAIEDEVTRTGKSTVIDDIATRMKEACWCETTNPMGSCCMSTVSQYVKAAKAKTEQSVLAATEDEFEDCCTDHGEPADKTEACCRPASKVQKDPSRKLGVLATVGAVFTALLSSACCWLPLLLITFGASAAGVSGFFEAYRFWFLGATGALLAVGFYLVYLRQEKCKPGSACAVPNPKLQRFNKTMLWVAAVVVALFSFFPNYLGVILGDTNAGAGIPDDLDQASMTIEGMTCQACATSIQENLKKVDGIEHAQVDYNKASALIGFPKGSQVPQQALLKAVENAGYTAHFQNLLTRTIAIEGMPCEACAVGAQQALSKVAGVSSAKVDFSKQQATVTSAPSVTDRSLQKAIEAAGYQASFNEPFK